MYLYSTLCLSVPFLSNSNTIFHHAMSNRADFHEESGVSEDLFSDSLESIFGHHQVCSFDGSICNPDARSPVKVNLEPNLPSKQVKTLDSIQCLLINQ